MGFTVIVSKTAEKEIDKLDRKTQKLIAAYIEKNLEGCDNPRSVPNSKPLKSVKDGWRWRVGSYRILGRINDNVITIELLRVGHRKDIYRNLQA